MSIRTINFLPFIYILFYSFLNIKVYFILNSLVFIYFLIYLVKLKPGLYVYAPPGYKLLFLAIVSSFLSFILSPLRYVIVLEYINFLSGFLLLFLVINSEEDINFNYLYPFFAIFIIVGIYQLLNSNDVSVTVKNANTFASISILIIGLLLEEKKYYLSLLFFAILIATKSIAAILSVMLTSFYYGYKNRKNIDLKNNFPVIFLLGGILFFLIYNIDKESIYDRILWWKASINIFLSRPLYGFGYGAFAYISGGFTGGHLKSTYVHNYFLETLSEGGILFSLFFFSFLYLLIKNSKGFYKYSLITLLIHNIFDFGINTSSGWWFFMYFAALSIKKERLIFKINDYYFKKYWIRYILIFSAILIYWFYKGFEYIEIENMNKKIYSYYSNGDYEGAINLVREAIYKYPSSFDLALTRVEILEKIYYNHPDNRYLYEIAKSIEYLLLLNPYYEPGYNKLEKIYKILSDEKALSELLVRKKKYFVSLF